MSVRQDKVQIHLEFLNEESKSLSRHIVDAKKLNDEVKALSREEQKLTQEFEKAAAAGKSTLEIELQRTKVQEQINDKLKAILKTGHDIEDLDLSKVVPAQLVSTAKELGKAMEFIPQSHPAYQQLAASLKKVNDQLATNRAATKGVSSALQDVATEGGKLGKVMELVLGFSLVNILETGIQKIKEWGVALYNRAKEIEFIGNKVKLVFGDASKDIEKFAETMKTKVGVAKNDVLKDLTSISNFFTTLELDKKYIPTLSKQLYELAGAWSQYNAGQYSVEEVSQTLMKALGGEVDELAELGIAVTEDTLKKELQKKGYDKLTGAAYDQASALTLIGIVQRKTTEAQEQFGKSSESMIAKQNRVTSFLREKWDGLAISFQGFFNQILTFGAYLAGHFETPVKSAVESINEMQYAFNRDIEVIKKANISTEERKKLINQLNKEYKDYLPNLVSENASEQELNKARERGNELFKQQIFYLAYKQKMTEIEQKASASARGLIDSEIADQKYKYDQLHQAGRNYEEKQALAMRGGIITALKEQGKKDLDAANKDLDIFKAAADKTAKEMGVTFEELEKKWNKPKEDIGIKFNVEKTQQELDKQMKLEIEAAKALAERRLVVLEKEKLQGVTIGEDYENGLYDIKLQSLEKQDLIYKKYKKGESLDAAKVAKEIVEIEKDKTKAILNIKLEELDKETALRKSLAESRFLNNTEGGNDPSAYDKAERAYKYELLEIDEQIANRRIEILLKSHNVETKEVIDQRNRILKIKSDRRALEQAQLEADNKAFDERRTKRINSELADIEEANEREEGVLRLKFANLIITEQDYALKKLEFKRAMIAEEIALLEAGGEREREQAKKKGADLVRIEADIEIQKVENAKRSKDLKDKLLSEGLNTAKNALDLGIEFLSQDVASRKKHASAIKAFEMGKIWVNAYAEISEIWRKNTATFGPLVATPISLFQSAVAFGRATLASSKVSSMKFAGGGFTGPGNGEVDETGEIQAGIVHSDEWVANRRFIAQNPQLFADLNRLQFANASIAGLNLMPKQSLYVPNYTVSQTATQIPQYRSSSSQELNQSFTAFKNEIADWQKNLVVEFSYQSYKQFENRLLTDFKNSNI